MTTPLGTSFVFDEVVPQSTTIALNANVETLVNLTKGSARNTFTIYYVLTVHCLNACLTMGLVGYKVVSMQDGYQGGYPYCNKKKGVSTTYGAKHA